MGSCFSSEGGGSKRKARTVTSQIPRAAEQAESIVPSEPTEPVIPGLVLCMLDGRRPPPSPSFVLAPTSGNVAPVLGLFFGSVLRFDFAAC